MLPIFTVLCYGQQQWGLRLRLMECSDSLPFYASLGTGWNVNIKTIWLVKMSHVSRLVAYDDALFSLKTRRTTNVAEPISYDYLRYNHHSFSKVKTLHLGLLLVIGVLPWRSVFLTKWRDQDHGYQ